MLLNLFKVRESNKMRGLLSIDKMRGLLSILLLFRNEFLINSMIQEHER